MNQTSQNILITGANSYTGARIYQCFKLALGPNAVIGTYNTTPLFPELKKLDLRERSAVFACVEEVKPKWIVHLAAIPNQASCEKDINNAHAVNIEGIQSLVDAGNKTGARVLFLSSESAYEDSLYGRLKKDGEEIAKRAMAGATIIQPAMIFGISPNTENDRPYNRLLRAVEKKQSIGVDSDLKFYPTWLGNLAEVILQVVERDIINETIPVVSERLCSRFELASIVLAPFDIEVTETHSGLPGSNAPLTQDAAKRLQLPCYTADEVIEFIKQETIAHFART